MDFDIVIFGAGIVGLAAANLLASTQLKIALVDRHTPPDEFSHSDDLRVSAINSGTLKVLEAVGAWPLIPHAKISPFYKMQVWDNLGKGKIEFAGTTIKPLGYIAENNAIQTALFKNLSSYSNIRFMTNAELRSFKSVTIQDKSKIEIELSEEKITAQLVIGADGADSTVRKLANIAKKEFPYQHSALICTVKTALPHNNIARQSFLERGPLAFLPLHEPHTSSIVWSMPPADANSILELSENDFKKVLTQKFSHTLGDIEEVSARKVFNLKRSHVEQYIKPQIALIGDAAHTIHPLAGQGLNLGIQDAIRLNRVIRDALQKKRNFASFEALRPYERWRKSENAVMIGFADMIHRVFSNGSSISRAAANYGLEITNKLTPLKEFLMGKAMGLNEDVT